MSGASDVTRAASWSGKRKQANTWSLLRIDGRWSRVEARCRFHGPQLTTAIGILRLTYEGVSLQHPVATSAFNRQRSLRRAEWSHSVARRATVPVKRLFSTLSILKRSPFSYGEEDASRIKRRALAGWSLACGRCGVMQRVDGIKLIRSCGRERGR